MEKALTEENPDVGSPERKSAKLSETKLLKSAVDLENQVTVNSEDLFSPQKSNEDIFDLIAEESEDL